MRLAKICTGIALMSLCAVVMTSCSEQKKEERKERKELRMERKAAEQPAPTAPKTNG